ncbi:10697_t:CDS:2, partial [Dentiscutata erythropus]
EIDLENLYSFYILETQEFFDNITKYCNDTICDYSKIFHDLVINSLNRDDKILEGKGIIVEIDESKFGDLWVVGITKRTGNKKYYLFKFIKEYVKPGSTLYSDCWKGYNNIEKLNIKHIRINHSRKPAEQQLICEIYTNTIEGTWNALKLFISKSN